MIKDAIMGSGTFHVMVQLLKGTSLLPQNYSLSSDEDVVVQVILNSTAELIKVVVSKCWATPSSNPTDNDSYVFLENRSGGQWWTIVHKVHLYLALLSKSRDTLIE